MLDERKMAILKAIIDSYIEIAEPVGSRTLSKMSTLGVSSATIRNEMSDLEELGFLNKTHSSSGRVPSDKAYRFYVNLLLESGIRLNPKSIEKLKRSFTTDSENSNIYETANKQLADVTKYTAFLISPLTNYYTIEYFMLHRLDEDRLMAVYVGKKNESLTHIIANSDFSDDKSLAEFELRMRNLLINYSIEDIKKTIMDLDQGDKNYQLTKTLLERAIKFLEKKYDYVVYSSGIGNVISFTEADDMETVKTLLEFFEDKENIINVSIDQAIDDMLNIRIGMENNDDRMKGLSVLTAKYVVSGNDSGKISIIGPTRMDYHRLVKTLLNFSTTLSELNRNY